MDYKKYTEGIIFIDDVREEVNEAIEYFKENNIKSLFFNPLDVSSNSSCLGYNFVFLDLSYSGSIDIKTAVIALKRIVEIGEKHFVVVAWTQHQEELEKLQDEINDKMADCYPLSLLNGEKFKILNRNEETDFNEVFSEMLNQLESENRLLFKLLEWKKNMTSAINENFNQLVENSYESNKIDLNKQMGILANNTLSKKSTISALNILNQKVNDSAIYKLNTMNDIVLEYDEKEISYEEKLKYNYQCLFSNSDTKYNIPGSIYKKGENISENDLKESVDKKEKTGEQLSLYENLYKSFIERTLSFDDIIPIVVDITPNCTYACKNINTTFLDGIIINNINGTKKLEFNIKNIKELASEDKISYKYMNHSKEVCILTIFLDKCSYDVPEASKICQLNNNIKVDIQHYFGARVSRVGTTLYEK